MSRAEQLVLRFKTFRSFVDEYSSRISEAGIFIASQTPHEVGTRVEFDLALSEEFPLLRGVGEVVWRVDPGSSTEWTPGMAVLFDEIDEPSRKLIHRLVEDYRQRGGTPFSLVRWPAGEAAPAPSTAASARPEPPPAAATPPANAAEPPPDTEPLRPSPYRGPVPDPAQRVDTTGWSALVDDQASPAGEVARLPWEGESAAADEAEAPAGPPDAEPPESETRLPEAPGEDDAAAELPGLPPVTAEPEPPAVEPPALDSPGAVAPPAFAVPEPPVAPAADAGADWGLGVVERGEPESLAELSATEEEAADWDAVAAPPAESGAEARESSDWGLGEPLAELPEIPEGIDEPAAEEETSGVRPPQPIRGAAQSAAARRTRLLGLLLVLASVAAVAVVWRNEEISTLAERWWPGAPPPRAAEPRSAPQATEPAPAEAVVRAEETVTVTAAAEEAPVDFAGQIAEVETPPPSGEPAAPPAAALPRERPRAEERTVGAGELTEVARVSWETRPGETVLLIVGNAEIAEESFRVSRLNSGAPRQLIQIRGITRPYGTARLEIGSPEIDRVRTGYHVDTQKRELHLVVDLAAAEVRMVGSELQGRVLRLTFSRP